MTKDEIVAALREHAEWAAGNEWETPITLGDDLSAAADLIENQQHHIAALRDTIQRRDAQIAEMSEGMAQFAKAVAVKEERNGQADI